MLDNHKAIENISWLANLRVIATISVILLHVAAPYLLKFGHIAPTIWWTANIYDSLVRFAVPIFVMITGALLLSRDDSTANYLKRRLTRILLPFIFWTIIYVLFDLTIRLKINPSNFDYFKFIVSGITMGASYHFWYIYMILGIYLIIPILRKWLKTASEKEIIYFLGIWLITVLAGMPFLSPYIPHINLSYFSGFIGYAVLGYYLSIKTFELSKIKTLAAVIFLFGFLATLLGTYFLSTHYKTFKVDFYNYLALNVVIASAGFFLWLKTIKLEKSWMITIRNFINLHSFGIYFIHVIILYLLSTIGITSDSINPMIGIPLLTILCLTISAAIIFLLKKLPFSTLLIG